MTFFLYNTKCETAGYSVKTSEVHSNKGHFMDGKKDRTDHESGRRATFFVTALTYVSYSVQANMRSELS